LKCQISTQASSRATYAAAGLPNHSSMAPPAVRYHPEARVLTRLLCVLWVSVIFFQRVWTELIQASDLMNSSMFPLIALAIMAL